MSPTQPGFECGPSPDEPGRLIDSALLKRIEQALSRVGEFGEVRLIVVKGQLKFIETVQSENLSEPFRRLDPGLRGS